MHNNISARGASALAGFAAAICSMAWLGAGLIVLVSSGAVA